MSDEIMVIEGITERRRRRKSNMSRRGAFGDATAMLNQAKNRLMSVKAWTDALKHAGGGAVGIVAAKMAVDRLPWIKDQSAAMKLAGMGLVGVLGSVALEVAGQSDLAAGWMGGVGGFAGAKFGNDFLPATLRANLGGMSGGFSAISREEQMFLNDIPGEDDLGEVSVEMNEVGIEDFDNSASHNTVHGYADNMAHMMARIS